MSSKVHSHGKVPFSWENKPGVSKAASATWQDHHHLAPSPKLSPPPCPENNKVSFHHDLQIPLQHPPAARQDHYHHSASRPKLPPPPCPPENSRVSFRDLQIPLPPCAFQPPSRSSSKKGLKKIDDPFWIAYKEVTKSTRKGGQGLGLTKNMSIFSCKKSSCSVAEDSVVRLSQLPISRSRRHGDYN
ncbi:hypothetical protein CDL12_15797 [Handroanthus impetiginosus]|uniref:Uncharacterized protein n=1 Tax=Handroanthus impetiginosus TaxID=429701 RepID=A0A2G9H254_9LAMI|nr:hypothetical protein CDL12_15797 [Handroanthus impetiginosus]